MSDPAPKPAGVSPAVLVLSVLLACAATAAAVLALRPAAGGAPRPGANPAPGGERPAADAAPPAEPFVQKDTVSPGGEPTGRVNYPIPFAAPPHLKLTGPGKREYVVIKQDELGFTWAARTTLEDLKPTLDKAAAESLLRSTLNEIVSSNLKPGLRFEDFTWEAKGVRGARLPGVFEQSGSFNTLPNTEGEVIYPIPYAQPANVELTGGTSSYVTITEAKATGFKWKNVTEKGREFFGSGSVGWKAKGLRAGDPAK